MRITSWNINGVRARMPRMMEYLKEASPDVIVLQEIKCQDENFPVSDLEELGYQVAVHGQKSFNGVALLSKNGFEDVMTGLPGDKDDEQARYIEASVKGEEGMVRVCGLYLPNGNPVEDDDPMASPKYAYKMGWMDRLHKRAEALLELEEPFLMGGDYNVIPSIDDVHDPKGWEGDALYRPETRRKWGAFCALGLTDAFRACHSQSHKYSYWDFQRGAWAKDHGIRIDHWMLSPQAADKLQGAGIDKYVRGREKPSDHVPVWVDLAV